MTGGLPAVLAVDGGSSKTDVALVAQDGSVLAIASGPGASSATPIDITLDRLGLLIDAVQQEAGRAGRPVAQQLFACLAHIDLPEQESTWSTAIRARGWAPRTEAVNDVFAVLRAGVGGWPKPASGLDRTEFQDRWGVAVTCGTGINAVGLAPDGRTERFLAFGDVSGDWGGGEGLGRATLWAAIRAEDGRGPDTRLRAGVVRFYAETSVRDVAIGIETGRIPRSLCGLSPLLLTAASDGDEVARSIVHRQADEISTMASLLLHRLDLAQRPAPVVLGGGVLAAGNALLLDRIKSGVTEQAPQARIRVVTTPPVFGAALLGLDRLDAPPGVEQRLRSVSAHRSAPFAGGQQL